MSSSSTTNFTFLPIVAPWDRDLLPNPNHGDSGEEGLVPRSRSAPPEAEAAAAAATAQRDAAALATQPSRSRFAPPEIEAAAAVAQRERELAT